MKKQFVLLILVAFISFLVIGCSSPDDKGEISESIIINGESISTTETQLKLDATKITDADLEQLKYMVNLSDLSISAYSSTLPNIKGNISDISALADLTNLTRLILANNEISDISPLVELMSLNDLNLNNNPINDISPLAELTSLISLNLMSTSINDISPLAGLTSLRFLSLAVTSIDDISPLVGLTKLTHLVLSGSSVTPEQIAELRIALPDTMIYSDY